MQFSTSLNGLLSLESLLIESIKIEDEINQTIKHLDYVYDIFNHLKQDHFFILDKNYQIEQIHEDVLTNEHLHSFLTRLSFFLFLSDQKKEGVGFEKMMLVHEKIDLILKRFQKHSVYLSKILSSKDLKRKFNELDAEVFLIPFPHAPLKNILHYFETTQHPGFKKLFQLNIEKHENEKISDHSDSTHKEHCRFKKLLENTTKSNSNPIRSIQLDHDLILNDVFYWDRYLFINIQAIHCIYHQFTLPNKVGFDRCAKELMEFSEKLNYFIRWSILKPKTMKKKSKALHHSIEMIQKLLDYQDFQGAFALYNAINAIELTRLPVLFEALSEKDLKTITYYQWLFSTEKNFKVYRELLALHAHPIPILQLFIKDNDIGNENVNGNDDKINLHKWNFYYHQCHQVETFQNQIKKEADSLAMQSNLYHFLSHMDLDQMKEEISRISHQIKPAHHK